LASITKNYKLSKIMKDPAVLFYTSDFITGTLTMTDAQRGKYILLLCLQHQQGYLTEDDMLNICKKYDEKIFCKFDKDKMGYYFNKRMLMESEKRNKHCEKQKERIQEYWDKKKKEDEYHGITLERNIPLINENENINEDINNNKVQFEIFWNLYDKKEDKIKCERKWMQLKKQEQEECIAKLPAYINSTPDKQFRKHPATYLNNKSWENEIIGNKNIQLTPQEEKIYEQYRAK
jgi:hypothetical protein